METIRNLFHKRDHPALRKLYNEWNKVTDSALLLKRDRSSLEYKEWNPFNDWCKSLEEFTNSNHKIPKSEMSKANMFFELSPLAHLIRDKLEEAKATAQENQSLIRQNFAWKKTYDELQSQLSDERKMRQENDLLVKHQLEKEVNLIRDKLEEAKATAQENQSLTRQNFTWQKKCDKLQSQLSAEREMRQENDLLVKHKLEKEVNLKKTLEFQNKDLELQVKMKEEELEQALATSKDLVNTLSHYKGKLVNYNQIGYQVNIKNDIVVVPDLKLSPSIPRGQLKNGEEERYLDPDSLKVIVEWLGKVNSLNVFDWLYTFTELYILSIWSKRDREQILCGCLDPSVFISILPILNKDHIIWLDIRKRIVERFIPNLDNLLGNEKMREDDTVLQYFHRMWMIYHCTEWSGSTDDPKYIKAILKGLLPHLYEQLKYGLYKDYETIECAALSAEYSWLQSENKRQDAYKARPGCPSRKSIWKRLEKYLHVVPYEEINGAPYWKLVVYLSRYEDLQTMEPRV